jgi:predicted nucleic acid-binding protein
MVQEAIAIVEDWLELPHFFMVLPSSRHFPELRALFLQLGTAGNLTTDVHLAALAIERGLVLHSTDADFGRFEGLKWINPIR